MSESKFNLELRLLGLLAILIVLVACNKDDERTKGFCYCDFTNGDTKEYDLTAITQREQEVECNRHDTNAAALDGESKLE